MANTVFFSWQSDTPTRDGRNFIERALERAVARISANTTIEEPERELQVDRDTKNIPGSPPIVETIFRKIDRAAVFLPDLTFIGKRPDGRPTPNPNVLIEYGWALKQMGHARIVPVMNTAFGEPGDALPFDLRHLRNPITYCCPPDLDEDNRKKVRDQLVKDLESAIRLVLESQEFRDSLPKPAAPRAYAPKATVEGSGRFKRLNEPIGLVQNFSYGVQRLYLSGHPICWFRLMPTIDPDRRWTIGDLETAIKNPILMPLRGPEPTGLNFCRSEEGYGVYVVTGTEREIASSVVFAFTVGEIWTIDTYALEASTYQGRYHVPHMEPSYRGVLVAYGKFLSEIGVAPPFRWIAGMQNLKGRALYLPTRDGHMQVFPVLTASVSWMKLWSKAITPPEMRSVPR